MRLCARVDERVCMSVQASVIGDVMMGMGAAPAEVSHKPLSAALHRSDGVIAALTQAMYAHASVCACMFVTV